MNTRAYMYISGMGGPVNFPAGIALFDQAIALGNTSAMAYRAFLYKEGKGEPNGKPNRIAAGKLFRRMYATDPKTYEYNPKGLFGTVGEGVISLFNVGPLRSIMPTVYDPIEFYHTVLFDPMEGVRRDYLAAKHAELYIQLLAEDEY